MKKKILFFLFWIITISSYCQNMTDYCIDLTWNWMDNSQWSFYLPTGKVTNCPFNGTSTPEFTAMALNKDLDPINGWVLITKQFGCPSSLRVGQ